MNKMQRTKSFRLGVVTFSYSFFLFCYGFLSAAFYIFIYPIILNVFGISPEKLAWLYTMSDFTKALVLGAPLVGGFIFMLIGYWLMFTEKISKNRIAGVVVLLYSLILFFQTVWVLFGYPHFSSELYRYLTSNIFINYPRFFILLGAIIPPLVGSILFIHVAFKLCRLNVITNSLEERSMERGNELKQENTS